jgi:hypothetical protein
MLGETAEMGEPVSKTAICIRDSRTQRGIVIQRPEKCKAVWMIISPVVDTHPFFLGGDASQCAPERLAIAEFRSSTDDGERCGGILLSVLPIRFEHGAAVSVAGNQDTWRIAHRPIRIENLDEEPLAHVLITDLPDWLRLV